MSTQTTPHKWPYPDAKKHVKPWNHATLYADYSAPDSERKGRREK